MRRTKTEAEQTRDAIIAAAITVFLERGFGRATFDEVARTAGVTRGAVYWHFRDKMQIFQALERRADLPNEAFSKRLDARLALAPDADPLDELADAIREAAQRFEADNERRHIFAILRLRCEYAGEMLPVLERREQADAALQQVFAKVFGAAAARGRLAPGWRPAMAARALFLLVRGSFEHWLLAPEDTRLDARIMPLVSGFLQLVRLPAQRD